MQKATQDTNPIQVSLSHLSGPRRAFLKSAGALAFAAPVVLAGPGKGMPGPSRWWHRGFELLAEGVVPFAPVSYVFPPPPMPPPPPGTPPLEARMRATFPVPGSKNLWSIQVYMVPEGLPLLPLPEAPPLVPQSPTDPVTISYSEAEIEDLRLGTAPVVGTNDRLPSFAMSGRIISNAVVSPFGELTGDLSVLLGSYLITDGPTGAADFVLLTASAAGNHASACPTAKGFLRLPK